MDIITYYDITEETLKTKAFESGAYYCCTDSRNTYFDSPSEQARVRMSSDTIILSTETERNNLLAPIPNKIYCILDSATLYIYNGGNWYRLGKGFQDFANVVVENGTYTYSSSNILNTSRGIFVPDFSVEDLASNIAVTCAAGTATITLTSDYPIPGLLIIQ